MSALPSKADILHHGFCVRFVPIADTCIMSATRAARRALPGPAAVMLLNPTYGKRGLHPTRDTCGPGGAYGRPANTIDHVHTRAAGVTDLSDHVVRLM